MTTTEETMNTGGGDAPPAVFLHACRVYERMNSEATDTPEGRVWEGHMTKLVTIDLELAIPYYTRVTQFLKGTECAAQLKRGGGTSASQWALYKEPTLDDYYAWEAKAGSKPVSVSKTSVLQQQMGDLTGRMETLEETVQTIIEAMKDK